jgi:hypothetical protein
MYWLNTFSLTMRSHTSLYAAWRKASACASLALTAPVPGCAQRFLKYTMAVSASRP